MVRPRSYWVIYYFDTPALGRRHQSFGRVNKPVNCRRDHRRGAAAAAGEHE